MHGKTKTEMLEDLLTSLKSVVVAFSGGVDSTLLLAMSLRILGTERVLAVTGVSPSLPRNELREARILAGELGARHVIVQTDELKMEGFRSGRMNDALLCENFSKTQTAVDTRKV